MSTEKCKMSTKKKDIEKCPPKNGNVHQKKKTLENVHRKMEMSTKKKTLENVHKKKKTFGNVHTKKRHFGNVHRKMDIFWTDLGHSQKVQKMSRKKRTNSGYFANLTQNV